MSLIDRVNHLTQTLLFINMADKDEYVYHENIGFPDKVEDVIDGGVHIDNLKPTLHALDRAKKSYYLDDEDQRDPDVSIHIPTEVEPTEKQIFEVALDQNLNLSKLGFRCSDFDVKNTDNEYEGFDLCLIVDPQSRDIITLYLNKHSDQHDTLDEDKYDNPTDGPH